MFLRLGTVSLILSLLTGSALGGIWFWPHGPDPQVVDATWLGRPSTSEQMRLHSDYPGDPYPFGVEKDYSQVGRVPQSHIDYPDGGSIDLYMRADGSKEFQLEYYAPSSAGKMLKHATHFAADGVTPDGEIAFRSTGTRQMSAVRQADGDYRTRSYLDDGQTLSGETLVGLGPLSYDHSAQLLSQTQWNKNHIVILTNILNQDDSRTISTFDDSGLPISVSSIAAGISGSSVTAYYPGTKVLRLKSSSTYSETNADIYRPDGTLSTHLTIGSASIEYFFYDSSGKRQTLQQLWYFDRDVKDGITRMKNYRLSTVTEMDAQGTPVRSWDIQLGSNKLWSSSVYNVVVDGEHWGEVRSFYDANGFLDRVSYLLVGEGSPKKMIDHTPAEAITGQPPPANLMILTPISDALPLPMADIGRH